MSYKIAVVMVALAAAPGLLMAGENSHVVVGNGLIGWTETTVPPQVRCVGGEPTGTFPPCSLGTRRVFSRSEQQIWMPASLSDPVASLLNGPLTFEVNCNMNAAYRGPCWGTFRWETPSGSWEGHWIAPVMDLMTYESRLSMVGFGEGGALDGKQLKVDGFSNPGDWYITFTARIQRGHLSEGDDERH